MLTAEAHGLGVRARVIEIKLDEEKLKLGLKESYFVGVEDEVAPDKQEIMEELDLDEEMLDAAEVDSDNGDWRKAALESPESADEGGSGIKEKGTYCCSAACAAFLQPSDESEHHCLHRNLDVMVVVSLFSAMT